MPLTLHVLSYYLRFVTLIQYDMQDPLILQEFLKSSTDNIIMLILNNDPTPFYFVFTACKSSFLRIPLNIRGLLSNFL